MVLRRDAYSLGRGFRLVEIKLSQRRECVERKTRIWRNRLVTGGMRIERVFCVHFGTHKSGEKILAASGIPRDAAS